MQVCHNRPRVFTTPSGQNRLTGIKLNPRWIGGSVASLFLFLPLLGSIFVSTDANGRYLYLPPLWPEIKVARWAREVTCRSSPPENRQVFRTTEEPLGSSLLIRSYTPDAFNYISVSISWKVNYVLIDNKNSLHNVFFFLYYVIFT